MLELNNDVIQQIKTMNEKPSQNMKCGMREVEFLRLPRAERRRLEKQYKVSKEKEDKLTVSKAELSRIADQEVARRLGELNEQRKQMFRDIANQLFYINAYMLNSKEYKYRFGTQRLTEYFSELVTLWCESFDENCEPNKTFESIKAQIKDKFDIDFDDVDFLS